MSSETLVECFTGGRGHEFLREGWSDIEEETWTVGRCAVLELPPPDRDCDYVLRLDVAAVAGPPGRAIQRISALVNETRIAEVVCRGNKQYEFFVSRAALADGSPVRVALELPNAVRPCDFGHNADTRFLALRVKRVALAPFTAPHMLPRQEGETGLIEQREALLEVQSLGVNCEVGFVQRLVGAEPLGLFRWTFAPLQKLVPALENGLEGLGGANSLEIHVDPRSEFIVRDKIYGFQYHSFVFENKGGTAEEVQRNEYNRLSYLSRTLIEELRGKEKLFAYHDAGGSGLEEVMRLVRALRLYGDNTLLWIVQAPQEALAGTASQIEPGLIQAHVSGFQRPVGNVVPTAEHQPSWLRAILRGHAIWRSLR
jgi:hypothetical protein